MLTETEALARFLDQWAQVIQPRYVPNCCVLATATACRVLDHYGLNVRPFPVRVTVRNQAAIEQAAQGLEAGEWTDDAWSIACGMPRLVGEYNADGQWNGHLICEVRHDGDQVVLDLAGRQFVRPGKIDVPPVFAMAGAAPRGRRSVRFEHAPSGCEIVYHGWPEATGYRKSGDWKRASKALAGEMIRRMDGAPQE